MAMSGSKRQGPADALIWSLSNRVANLGPLIDDANEAKDELQEAIDKYLQRRTMVDSVTGTEYRWCMQVYDGVPYVYLSDVEVDSSFTDDTVITDGVTGTAYTWEFTLTDGVLAVKLTEVV